MPNNITVKGAKLETNSLLFILFCTAFSLDYFEEKNVKKPVGCQQKRDVYIKNYYV